MLGFTASVVVERVSQASEWTFMSLIVLAEMQ
jgi:hypothetical protein